MRIATAMLVFGMFLLHATLAVGQESIGDFYLFERPDPASGVELTSITTLADESFVSGAGGLTFRCAKAGFELVVTASYLGRRPSTPVRYSFGGEERSPAAWTLRPSGMAAVAPPQVREDFVSRALEASAAGESAVIRVSDFQMSSHTYTFHLDGLAEALTRLSCR